MTIASMTKRTAEASHHQARLVGAYYLFTLLTGVFILFFHGRMAFTADVIASAVYLAVTALFWVSAFKHVHRGRVR